MNAPLLHYYDIAPGVRAFSTTRHGGFSLGNHGGFNINEHCGDTAEAIAKNRRLLADELSVSPDRIVMPHQTHGVETRQIAGEFLALPEGVRKMVLEGVDGVMTDVEGICIGVSTADCIPVLLYDEEHRAACAVHAGWRGTLARIAMKAAADMRLAYATRPEALKAVIGPGISFEAFEVGDEVYEQFVGANFDMEGISRQMKSASAEAEYKWHIDLKECNRRQLMQAGVAEGNIHVSPVCTYRDVADYFSARRLGADSGRIFTGILL